MKRDYQGADGRSGVDPEQRTSHLDAREQWLRERERVADARDAAASDRARRLRELTSRAEAAIERAQLHMETSTERLQQSHARLEHCLDSLRWLEEELGSDLTSPLLELRWTVAGDGKPVDRDD